MTLALSVLSPAIVTETVAFLPWWKGRKPVKADLNILHFSSSVCTEGMGIKGF